MCYDRDKIGRGEDLSLKKLRRLAALWMTLALLLSAYTDRKSVV